MKNHYRKIFAVLMAIVAMMMVYFKMGIYFETNDDRIITEMLSGAITHIPDACVQMSNYLLAAPIAWLYRMVGGIPWYGIILIFFHAVSYVAIFESILSCCSKKHELAVGIALGGALFLINLYLIGLIQWTSSAALLAISGYVYLIVKSNKKAVWLCAGFQLAAYCLRSEAMLMMQPLGGTVLLGFFVGEGRWKEKEWQKLVCQWMCSILGVVLLGLVSDAIAYRGSEWQTAKAYNRYRAELMDFYGIPPYDDVEDILNKYQVTATEYEGFANYVAMDSHVVAECLKELVSFVKSNSSLEIAWKEILRLSFTNTVRKDAWTCNRPVGMLWIAMLLWLPVSKKKALLVPMLSLAVVRTAVWCYIIYRGRMPNRVTYPLFFAEIVLLLTMILRTYAGIDYKTYWHKMVMVSICALVIYQGYKIGQTQYRYVRMVNDGQAAYIESYKEIKEYCRRYPNNRYVLDSYSFSFYKGSALETEIYRPGNGIYSGGWNSQSPAIKAYEREYMGDWDDFYVIAYDDGQPTGVQERNIIVRYFMEKTGVRPHVSDTVTVSSGGAYLVWRFGGDGVD